MDEDKVNARVTSSARPTVAEIFPITPAKVKAFMTQERQRTPVKSILVTPKTLVVSIVEDQTSVSLEKVFEQRAKEVKDESRGSSQGKTTQSEGATVAKSWATRSGASSSLVVQELIQLVRSVVEENDFLKKRGDLKVTARQSEVSRQSTERSRSQLLSALNRSLAELHEKSWSSEFSQQEKQRVLGLLAVISGWQPCIRFG